MNPDKMFTAFMMVQAFLGVCLLVAVVYWRFKTRNDGGHW